MAKQPKSLAGNVVAITGAARGIGRATAAALIAQGARVAIGDLDLEAAERTAEELGPNARAFELDVTERASVARFLDAVEEQLGPLDAIVNNAGIMPLGPFIEESDETAHLQIDINLHGVLYGIKEALPRMLKRGRGHVINIASMAGKVGFPGGATYCATKHAVVGITEAVAAEHHGSGVEFSVVMPGVVNTELAAGIRETGGIKMQQPEDVATAIVETLRLPRFDVFVPRQAGWIHRTVYPLPHRFKSRLGRALKADRPLTNIDSGQRAAYEDRAAHSRGSGGSKRGRKKTAAAG